MTAEPTRDPENEPTRESVDASVPTPRTDEPEASAAQAAAVDAGAVDAGPGAVDAGGVDAGAVDAPVADPTAVDAATVETPAVAVDAPPTQAKVSRRPVIVAALRRLLMITLAIALFVGGVVLGTTTFQRTRPVPIGVQGSISVTEPPPAVAQEFITALAANDADALRSSLSAQPNKDLTDEFERFTIKRIVSVETLGTSVDGSRSATEILMRAENTDGLPFEVNLVILVDGGQIEGFR
jgi:hypothetical protein